jgi:hypothetical protein
MTKKETKALYREYDDCGGGIEFDLFAFKLGFGSF